MSKHIHALLDRHLNDEYHFDYTAVHQALSMDTVIQKLHQLSLPPNMDPLLISQAENASNATEIISSNFVSKACAHVSDMNVILVVALRKAMRDAGFAEGKRNFFGRGIFYKNYFFFLFFPYMRIFFIFR